MPITGSSIVATVLAFAIGTHAMLKEAPPLTPSPSSLLVIPTSVSESSLPGDDLSSKQELDYAQRSNQQADYTQLRDLLTSGKWKEANALTSTLVLRLAGQEQRGYLVANDTKNLPCQNLRTIDQLWLKSSNSRFGFSVQARIWQRIGGKDYKDSLRFEQLVGWNKEQLIPNPKTAPEGHLPLRPSEKEGIMNAWGGWWIAAMPARLKACGIIR
jgi:hypothetical protein